MIDDRSKFNNYIFEEYKEEIAKNKERYKPILLELLKKDEIVYDIYKEIVEIWEKEWKEEPSIEIDKLKFSYYTFQKYKEEIMRNKERYKSALLKAVEENKIDYNMKKEIIEIWEKEWKEEPSIEIDKLKFKLLGTYREEIKGDKERYKVALLKMLEEDKIDKYIYEDIIIYEHIIKLWEKEWKEESNIEIDKLKFDWNIFKKYKEEISRNKERYKPALLELLEKNKIDYSMKKEIVEIWEKEWKEEANVSIDRLKFKNEYIFKEYEEEISRNKERYKPILLELLDENEIDSDIYIEIIDIWEEEWKEEANVNIDRLKFNRYWGIFSGYKEEIVKNKERYKPILLELLEKYKLSEYIYEDIIKLWEKEWKEEPNIYIDKLKFRDYRVFKEYKKEIKRDKEKYKPVLLKAVEENIKDILGDLYLSPSVVRLWDNIWKEEPNVEIDKLIFGGWYFDEDYKEYLNFDEDYELDYEDYVDDEYYNYMRALRTKRLIENPKRYKPVLLKLLEENIDTILSDIFLCSSVIRLWEWEWKEEPNIDIDKLKFYDEDSFYDFEEEIIANPKRYKPALLELILDGYDELYDAYSDVLDEWEEKELEM